MVSEEEPKQTPSSHPKNLPEKQQNTAQNVENNNNNVLLSPGFRSVAAMAGWDEEALLVASLVVEDTPPDRLSKHKKRSVLPLKSPPTSSRRKRRAQRRNPVSIPVAVLNLDEDESANEESENKKKESKTKRISDKKVADDESNGEGSGVSCSPSAIPCMDKLRDELSCAICLEICFEPSTTPCGHSFCKKCLRSAADKCGKRCPKCRQLISNGRSCTINTVLWNTIQLLFPQEVEARKAASSSNSREANRPSPARGSSHYNVQNRRVLALDSPESEHSNLERRRSSHHLRNRSIRPSSGVPSRRDNVVTVRRSREVPDQDEDAALALRLQREEFMEAFRGPEEPPSRSSLMVARANLRAMASRAVDIRMRRRDM